MHLTTQPTAHVNPPCQPATPAVHFHSALDNRLPRARLTGLVTLHIACNCCGRGFPAETHAGLVRCPACVERLAFRLAPTLRAPVVFE